MGGYIIFKMIKVVFVYRVIENGSMVSGLSSSLSVENRWKWVVIIGVVIS